MASQKKDNNKDNNNKKEQPAQSSVPEGSQVVPQNITAEMKDSYLDYAMSVITSRALPDVRDGLKPVHRRILYAMHTMNLTSGAKFRKSAAIVGECFVKDTLISTPLGLRPIQNIEQGDMVYTHRGVQKVVNLFVMPKKKLLRVTTEDGMENTVTPEQPMKILTPDLEYKWKKAKELNSNDTLVLRTAYPEIDQKVPLPKYNDRHMELNGNIAYLLGMLLSDGWISFDYGKKNNPRLGFYSEHREVIEQIQSILVEEFDYQPTIEEKQYSYINAQGYETEGQGYTIRVNKLALTEYVLDNFFSEEKKLKASNKYIPLSVLRSPQEVLGAFLSGLIDGDGSINDNRRVINYSTVSRKLANQLQVLLFSCQIAGSRYLRSEQKSSSLINEKEIVGRFPSYGLEIRGQDAYQLAQICNYLAHPRKKMSRVKIITKQKVNSGVWNRSRIVPYAAANVFPELSKYHRGSGWFKDTEGNSFRAGIKYQGGGKMRYAGDLKEKHLQLEQVVDWGILDKLERIGSPLSEFFTEVRDKKIRFRKVAQIESAEPEETYDMEVENDHQFIANGMLAHNCLGNYHPHGDSSVYEAMVKMAQEFVMRYKLVQGQGNFGSIDGDSPAAMRYTEARMSKLAPEMLRDIEKETVDWRPNYDDTKKEPTVLPAAIPNLLLNGILGIAVGMATNIPPHNLREIVEAVKVLLDNPQATTEELLEYVKGPDFPTAGVIFNEKDIHHAYATGRGGVVTRGVAEIEEAKGGTENIIIKSIPYRVNKADLIMKIADLVKNKKVEGIKGLRDESTSDIRVVVELKQGVQGQTVLNYLYKYTQLEDTFYFNMVALVDGVPQTLSLKGVLEHFISHRKEVIRRRTEFDLAKARDREHILIGLKKALDYIDEIIQLIKKSKDAPTAHGKLKKRFGFSDRQATAILEMRLQKLAGLERKKVEEDLKATQALIKELESILKSPKKVKNIIKDELSDVADRYGDDRLTQVIPGEVRSFSPEDLVPDEESILVMTSGGYVKRTNPNEYKKQKRGGMGVADISTKEEDFVTTLLTARTHSNILFFTDAGKVYKLKMYEIPEGRRSTKGKSIKNFLSLEEGEQVTSVLPTSKDEKHSDWSVLMVTKQGVGKRVNADAFRDVRKNGLIAMKLSNGDSLKSASFLRDEDSVIATSRRGSSIHFAASDIREMGRGASGVRVMKLDAGDEVVSAEVVKKEYQDPVLLTMSEKGHGKKTSISEYKQQKRGGSGIKTAQLSEKTGGLMIARVVESEEELIAISQKGHVIRVEVSEIPMLKRGTQGVTIMKLKSGDSVAAVICV